MSDKESDHKDENEPKRENSSSPPCKEDETDEDNKTEDDPLSDVWDSDDSQFDEDGQKSDEEAKPVKHVYEKIKTRTGTRKIDMTPPDVLLVEAHANMHSFYKKKMSDECIKEAVRCLTLTIIIEHYEKPWLLAKCEANIGKMYWQLKEYPLQTKEHAEKALKYLSLPLIGKDHPEKKEILETALLATYLLGKSDLAKKKYDEAENHFLKAEKILEERKKLGKMKEKDFWSTELNTALARIKVHQKKINEGITYLESVKSLMEKRYGEDNPKLIPIYQEISKLEQMKGSDADFELAVELCAKAHSIAEANFEEENPLRGDAAYALAVAHSIERSEEAEIYTESYLNEAISNYEISLGKSHAKTLKAQQTLAEHLASRKRPQEAMTLLETSLPYLIENLGEDSYQRARVEKLLATFCLQSGEVSSAKKHLKECYRIENIRYGSSASKTKATKEALDILMKNPKVRGKKENVSDKPRFSSIIKPEQFSSGYKPIPLE